MSVCVVRACVCCVSVYVCVYTCMCMYVCMLCVCVSMYIRVCVGVQLDDISFPLYKLFHCLHVLGDLLSALILAHTHTEPETPHLAVAKAAATLHVCLYVVVCGVCVLNLVANYLCVLAIVVIVDVCGILVVFVF